MRTVGEPTSVWRQNLSLYFMPLVSIVQRHCWAPCRSFSWPAPRIHGQTMRMRPEAIRPHSHARRRSRSHNGPGSTHPAVRKAVDNGRLSPMTVMSDLVWCSNAQPPQGRARIFNARQYICRRLSFTNGSRRRVRCNYGVANSDLETVTNWLQIRDSQSNEISPSRTSIRFSGNVGHVEAAFHTEMHSITSLALRISPRD